MQDMNQVADLYVETTKAYLDILIERGDLKACEKYYLEILDKVKKETLEVSKEFSKTRIMTLKALAFVSRKLNIGEDLNIVGNVAPSLADTLLDNYDRVRKGIAVTSKNMSYDNICTLISQKAESDKYLVSFSSFLGDTVHGSSALESNYNYYLTCQSSRDKILELDSKYCTEKTKDLHY